MKNRPLLSVCLMVLCIIASMVVWGRERFIKELRPSRLNDMPQKVIVLPFAAKYTGKSKKRTAG